MVRADLRNLDLNLLLTLDALLAERNVTRAAVRLGVTQPAVSAALARLRRHFGDPLLSRVGNRYELTLLAAQLRVDTTLALAAVRRVFEAAPDFDPAITDREFSLVLSDYAAAVMGEALSQVFAARAPQARLRIQGPDALSGRPCRRDPPGRRRDRAPARLHPRHAARRSVRGRLGRARRGRQPAAAG